MSEIQDLLNASTQDMVDDYLIIDDNSREIYVPSGELLFGVTSDEKTERKYFQCPRIVGDNVDLTQYQLYINYQNANGEKDKYIVNDVKVVDDNITFTWLLSRKVTEYQGNISFIVCARNVDSSGNITNEWNTAIATGTCVVGLEVDYILIGAYEASIYDTSASTYLKQDEQVADFDKDLLCSISNVKPCSGLTQNLTSANAEKLAKNRGEGWHSTSIKDVSLEQLLMIIELGTMNTQNGINQGVVSIVDNSSYNCAVHTGSTSSLGNATGRATTSIGYKGVDRTEYTGESQTSISFRGVKNFWGNIWKLIEGLRFWGNTHCLGGQPYVCKDFNYTENKHSDNYESVGFTLPNSNGYVKAMGYDKNFDWLFIPSKVGGDNYKPVGDYTYVTSNLNDYRVALLGGRWFDGSRAGGFYWNCNDDVGTRHRAISGRLVYIPNLKNW